MKHVLLFENYNSRTNPTVFYHGTTEKGFFGKNGIHIGTKLAATQALEARIGVPAEGEWDGTRKYGETLLAGTKTLQRRQEERGYFLTSGFNCGRNHPTEDYYPTDRADRAKYSDATEVSFDCSPTIFPVVITGRMKPNTISDYSANVKMMRNLGNGEADYGFYYTNDGEDVGSTSAVVPNGSFLKLV